MRVHLCLISPELQYCQTPQFVWILLNFLQYSDSHILYKNGENFKFMLVFC